MPNPPAQPTPPGGPALTSAVHSAVALLDDGKEAEAYSVLTDALNAGPVPPSDQPDPVSDQAPELPPEQRWVLEGVLSMEDGSMPTRLTGPAVPFGERIEVISVQALAESARRIAAKDRKIIELENELASAEIEIRQLRGHADSVEDVGPE